MSCSESLQSAVRVCDCVVMKSPFCTSFLRILIASWLPTCFLLSAAYAGNLKGFLANPGMSPKVETVQQVLDSGLPFYWHRGFDGSEKSSNPTIKKAADTGFPLGYQGYTFEEIVIEKNAQFSFLGLIIFFFAVSSNIRR